MNDGFADQRNNFDSFFLFQNLNLFRITRIPPANNSEALSSFYKINEINNITEWRVKLPTAYTRRTVLWKSEKKSLLFDSFLYPSPPVNYDGMQTERAEMTDQSDDMNHYEQSADAADDNADSGGEDKNEREDDEYDDKSYYDGAGDDNTDGLEATTKCRCNGAKCEKYRDALRQFFIDRCKGTVVRAV